MTTEPIPQPAQQPYAVVANPGTRLEQLQAEYASAKAAADAANERLSAIKDGIKAELQAAVPDHERIELRGGDGVPTLELAYVERATFDSKKLKADGERDEQLALLYVRYAKFGGSWTLREKRGS